MKEVDFGKILKASRIFGERHWCRDWFDKLCIVDQKFLQHVAEQEVGYQHYLCLISIGFEISGDITDDDEQAQLIRSNPRRFIIGMLFGGCTRGLVNLLPKLGNTALSKANYLNLVQILDSSYTGKALHHSHRIYPVLMEIMNKLPHEFRQCSIVMKLRTRKEGLAFLFMIRSVVRIRHDLRISEIARSLSSVQRVDDLDGWFDGIVEKGPYPAPPWAGNNMAIPIDTRHKLGEIGREFENCVENYSADIVMGVKYFYHGVIDSIHYVLSLEREIHVGWVVEEIEGLDNRILSQLEMERVLSIFQEVNFDFKPSEYHQFVGYRRFC